MRFLSVCSGMEAASVAWEPLGWKAVGFSEIEPFPCAILKHRFPNTPNYGSLTNYAQWPIEPGSIDLLVGGTPCQSFSVAGLRKGMADPRGNLALVFLGLADRVKPRWIVWENVPGVLSSNGGRDFGAFLGALEQLGYGWAYRVLDAQHFGVPQRRRRVFVVASLGGRDVAASVLLKPESLCWHPAKGRKKGQATAPDAGSGVEAGNGCWWDGGQVSQTLDAVLQKGQTMPEKNRFPAVLQPLTYDMKQHHNPQSSDNVQLTTKNYAFIRGDTPLVQPIPFRKSKRACSTTDNKTCVLADASNTLNNFDLGDTRTTHAVVNNVAPTIGASGPPYSRTGNERVEADALAITFQSGNLRREAGADPSTTTTTTTLKASAGDQMPHVATPMAVRRLTPTECERLQGFPDNWSRIPWKGKPEDQCPDGPRYKACGNSMAVPVMRWIGEQIARVELSHNQPTNTNA